MKKITMTLGLIFLFVICLGIVSDSRPGTDANQSIKSFLDAAWQVGDNDTADQYAPHMVVNSVSPPFDYSDNKNDLIFHDYGTGIKMTNNSRLEISRLDLMLRDETAKIFAIDLKSLKTYKLCDYESGRDIIFTPDSEGVYQIIVVISNGETIDITPKGVIETTIEGEKPDGFILLE